MIIEAKFQVILKKEFLGKNNNNNKKKFKNFDKMMGLYRQEIKLMLKSEQNMKYLQFFQFKFQPRTNKIKEIYVCIYIYIYMFYLNGEMNFVRIWEFEEYEENLQNKEGNFHVSL